MTNNQMKYGIGGLIIGAVVVWLIIGSSSNFGWRGMMDRDGMDGHFIEQMIPHHEDAITMANLALTKAQHPEIKQLAESIIDSQSKEIDQMKMWYKDWYGQDVPAGTHVMSQHGMMGSETDITRLEKAADFDKVFIEEMIPHHQMAVMMATMLKAGTQRLEMQQLADDIATAQTREINQMKQWYDTWY